VWKDERVYETGQMLIIIGYTAEYKSSVIDYRGVENRDLRIFGLNVNELLHTALDKLSNELFYQFFEEFYWFMETTTLKTSKKSDSLQGLWYKAMAMNIDNYLALRTIDGLFSWTFALILCCNSSSKIDKLPEWHYEC